MGAFHSHVNDGSFDIAIVVLNAFAVEDSAVSRNDSATLYRGAYGAPAAASALAGVDNLD